MRAERYLEIGVFTGYSSTAMALALPEHGRISACDINVSFTDIARQSWADAGVAHKISLYLQPALLTLAELLEQGEALSYDIAFIDADKAPTPQYYEYCLAIGRSRRPDCHRQYSARRPRDAAGRQPQPAEPAHFPGFQRRAAARPAHCADHAAVGDGLTLLLKK